ncbi:hypothetical protein [Mycolicibacterium sp. CH28]|uniref:hypothetical protein n=1 Tax=Mycolicibacterium sp. CH28 TaxID=2512237 RepID=UPI001F36ECC5|nr:hypothetical protein [Mycolicibacterium sp. CH28]
MRQYKANLGLLTNRYAPMEIRLLEAFAQAISEGHPPNSTLVVPGGMAMMYWYLLRDGIIEAAQLQATVAIMGIPAQEGYRLTAKGVDLVQRWFSAEEI